MVVKKRSMGVRPWRITVDPVRALMDTVIAGVGYLMSVFRSPRIRSNANVVAVCWQS